MESSSHSQRVKTMLLCLSNAIEFDSIEGTSVAPHCSDSCKNRYYGEKNTDQDLSGP